MGVKLLDRLRARLGGYAPLKLAVVAALVGLFVGAGVLAGTSAGLAWTNTEQFCIGCHEMKDNVYAEFKGTIHDTNRSGVRATCSDCHVPKEIGPKLVRKVHATWELYGAITGKIDTKEKFEKHRLEMAQRVWTSMKETDSRECRNCHTRDAMSKDLQSAKAQARHAKGVAEGKTCIDCHFGIAHTEPDGPGPQDLPAVANR
ncbi:NapC/NirT family cytochrome c [Piscinibacter sp.]|uniref:NapC/NirT family cytochrome c n=1 Tax=Piscinibacter sp. TaxID=1903157 RepID=UPI002BF41D5F|nr:NapC/NirT family cytochrome c [Albitalea sp.]HUG22386.1 NapC/NirT family cytochrome c [Albitalea sp.]